MAKEFDNTNRGALFKNKDKKTDDHPDYTGRLNVGSDEFWLSAWLKTSKAGQKYMSLSVTPAEQKTRRKPDPAEMDDGTPF